MMVTVHKYEYTIVGVRLQPIKSDLGFLSKLLVVGVTEGSLADHHGNFFTVMMYLFMSVDVCVSCTVVP